MWLRSFASQEAGVRKDLVLLQETHVEKKERERAVKEYAAKWGFRSGGLCEQLSWWSSSKDRKGGVACLIHPYGGFKHAQPVLEEHWSPYFMAIQGHIDGVEFLLLNVYAPHVVAERERFYRQLARIELPAGAKVLLGGDFNCTQEYRVDRSYAQGPGTHKSAGLDTLLGNWCLEDALLSEIPEVEDVPALHHFHTAHHTYRYNIPGKGEATSRLDRWYLSSAAMEWLRKIEVIPPVHKADHRGVQIWLGSPTDPVRIRKPAQIFPAPHYAVQAVRELTLKQISDLGARVQDMSVAESAKAWECFKLRIAKDTLRTVRDTRKRRRNSYKQRLKRLL
ncbi:reverse transcriptase [Phytophthora megakarya]|uniref:Reverse transcriptase n=1 Tax=Phytophthora megakarya TaxID=4795 RepID=A0A225WI34_9STRA|nr:reverse transcriptase [Phytophthora megakarya]